MKNDDIPHRNEAFRLRELEGETILYHEENTVAVYLNQTASMVWQLCDGERTVADIETLLADAYPEADNIGDDLKTVLQPLIDNQAILLK